jgi:spermidine synthase
MASKNGAIKHFREEDAANKPFPTTYYNTDIHRAALATPEFMRRVLEH